MTWIHNKQRQPYSYKKDSTIIDKKKETPAKIKAASVVWFKTKCTESEDGKVFQDTLDNVTKKRIKWEWWQPLNRVNGLSSVGINPSNTPSEMQPIKRTW